MASDVCFRQKRLKIKTEHGAHRLKFGLFVLDYLHHSAFRQTFQIINRCIPQLLFLWNSTIFFCKLVSTLKETVQAYD